MQNPDPQAPLPAQPIEYYTPEVSTLPGLVKITGFLVISLPIAWILMMPFLNAHNRIDLTGINPLIYIFSAILTLFSIIGGIRLLARHNHTRALILFASINALLSLLSFALLYYSLFRFTFVDLPGIFLIASMALSLNIGFTALIMLLSHIRAHPDFPSYWK